ncbi:hypothetical protein RINTHM_12270 [Richelia intracellularis HM01]|nr:hypothetical protein RINTHM_12270 [Richelia intracellularis HM01]
MERIIFVITPLPVSLSFVFSEICHTSSKLSQDGMNGGIAKEQAAHFPLTGVPSC